MEIIMKKIIKKIYRFMARILFDIYKIIPYCNNCSSINVAECWTMLEKNITRTILRVFAIKIIEMQ